MRAPSDDLCLPQVRRLVRAVQAAPCRHDPFEEEKSPLEG